MGFRYSSLVVGAVAAVAFSLPAQGRGQVLELKQMSLEELLAQDVTSVSKRPEPYGQAPAAIQVITQDDIRRSGATTLADALRLADNLIVAQKSAQGWNITARGFNTDLANKLLVLMDGRTVYTPLFSGVFWDRQNYLLEDIDRIEVISGPGGTLWGANAVNGVINIITRRAEEATGVYAEAGFGNKVGITGGRYGGRLSPTTSFRVYGKAADHDHELTPAGGAARDSWVLGQGGFRMDTSSDAPNAFTLQGDFYSGRNQVGTGGLSEVSGGNVIGRWSHTSSPSSGFSLQLYYDRTHLLLPVPAQVLGGLPLAPAGTLTDDLDTVDVDFQHRMSLGRRHRLSWGAGYRFMHDDVGNAPALSFIPAVFNQSLFSVFGQDEITLSDRLTLTAGSKVEHNAYTAFEVEPSARLQWTVTPKHMVWGAVSRAIRAPSRVDRHERLGTPGLAPFVPNLLVGGENFIAETVVAYEAGTRAQLGPNTSLSVSAFFNQYDHLRSTNISPPDPVLRLPFPLFFENNLEGDTHGVELTVDQQVLSWWRLHAGYAFLSEDIRVKPGRFDFNQALNETADPPHRMSLRSSMTVARVEIDATYRWVDGFRYNNSGVPAFVDSYGELNGRVGFSPVAHLELSVVGQNLLNPQHAEYVVSNPNPRVEMGRRAYAKAALRW